MKSAAFKSYPPQAPAARGLHQGHSPFKTTKPRDNCNLSGFVGVRFFANRAVRPGTAEQWIKEGKNAVKWTRLSCRAMVANAVRLQLHALAYNLANFMPTLALPGEMESWSLTTIREKLLKIGAKVVTHARYAVFQTAEVAVPRALFGCVLALIDSLRPPEPGLY